MFVRIKTTPNSPRKSVQLVESSRVNGKVKQRIIRHVGIAMNDDELVRLQELAEYIRAKLENEIQPVLFPAETMAEMAISSRRRFEEEAIKHKEPESLPVQLEKLREQQRVSIGIHDVCGKLYNELGFDKLFSVRKQAARRNLFHIAMARIANPASKRASVEELASNYGIELNLQSVYRMMEEIDDNFIKKLNKLAWTNANSLLGEEITCTLYDCTTLYFESFTEDELKCNGYSKDMKFNQPQVMLGLLTSSEGLPLGYEVFPGNQYEGHTLVPIFEKLKSQYGVLRIIFVADSAMLNDKNLSYIESQKEDPDNPLQFEYIVGARLKNLSKDIHKEILGTQEYESPALPTDYYEKIREISLSKKRRLVVSHSRKRAEKSRHDRIKNITKVKAKLSKSKNPKAAISNYGYKKYLKVEGKASLQLDETRIEAEARWDGLHGVISNVKDMSKEKLLEYYHNLWHIEACFRVSKHDLQIRPVYHWTPQKIKAHIAICFLSLVITQHLAYRTALRFSPVSAEKMRKELNSVQVSILKDIKTNECYGVPSNITHWAKNLYTVMGLSISEVPYRITPNR